MLAHVPSFGRNPRGSPDFLAYPVPKACMHVLGTEVPRRLGVARSASSPKAAQALGCSLTPGLRISFGRITCMARAASVPGLSAKLKTENASGKGGGKGNTNKDNGQGKFKGNGKGQSGKGKRGRGGGDRKPDKDKNTNLSGGNLNSTAGGNPEPAGRQPNTGPTTRSQTQGQQEQGTKRANEDGDQSNARKRSRFMRMARKLQKKGFEVTCPAEF